jgi:hypothetical protein
LQVLEPMPLHVSLISELEQIYEQQMESDELAMVVFHELAVLELEICIAEMNFLPLECFQSEGQACRHWKSMALNGIAPVSPWLQQFSLYPTSIW